jgi:Tfp pilus assembly PilM family ATPase
VQRVVLSGGTAQLPGLVQYVTETLGTEVLVASPFAQSKGEIPELNQTAYSVCMGLLMRSV